MLNDNPLLTRHAIEGATPEGALALWFAACLYAQSNDPGQRAIGEAALTQLTLPLREDPEWKKRPAQAFFVERLKNDRNVFRSYARGATPQNAYAADPDAFAIEVTRQEPGPNGIGLKLFVRSSGADSPRPVSLKRSNKTNLYYVDSFNSLYVGVRPPIDPNAETFE